MHCRMQSRGSKGVVVVIAHMHKAPAGGRSVGGGGFGLPGRRAAVASLIVIVVSATPVFASSGSPALTGRVAGDVVVAGSNHPVANAVVSLPAFGVTTRSSADGTFRFSRPFPTGRPYRRITAIVTAPGYGRWTVRGLPLWPNDTLELHAELRSTPFTHSVVVRPHVAQPQMAPEVTQTATCTGWTDQLVPPPTIAVELTRQNPQVAQRYGFTFYVSHVLPDEWIPSWDADALGAGAIAVKNYAWYRTQPGHARTSGTGCADILDNTYDQVFDPTYTTAATDAAVFATMGSIAWRSGSVFVTQYYAGSSSDPCAPVTGTYAGRMSQWGSQTCAKNGMLWPAIVSTFYGVSAPITWHYRGNLLFNPTFASASMYMWTKKGPTSYHRTSGDDVDGDGYSNLITPTISGGLTIFRQQHSVAGTATSTYHAEVSLMCPATTASDCSVTLRIVGVPASSADVNRDKVASVPNDGAWPPVAFDVPPMDVAHTSVRFALLSKQQFAFDKALLTTPFGGP
ncbi:MAG TPA: hypothetical protein DIU14_05515 [Actinobacteria bacterium]|nr:hypothetical protein [Actinomycetota bacterium]